MPGGLLRAGVPIKTRYAYTPPRRRQPPRNLCDVPLSGWYHIQDCYTLAQQRHVGNPQSAVEELVIFVTYFFNDSKQTHLLQTGPQNLGKRVVLQPAQRRYAGSCSLEGLVACQPRPKARTTVPAADPARAPRPGQKRLHSRCSGPETGG